MNTGIINVSSPLLALAIANWLEAKHGFHRNCNIAADVAENSSVGIMSCIAPSIHVTSGNVVWHSCTSFIEAAASVNSVDEFIAWFDPKPKSWKIGCRTVELGKGCLCLAEDNIEIPRETLADMLKAIDEQK